VISPSVNPSCFTPRLMPIVLLAPSPAINGAYCDLAMSVHPLRISFGATPHV
jgi:hypothetical protein